MGKRLTIRAAGDSQPVLLMHSPTARAAEPWLRSDADLRLEGLEIHWSIESTQGFSEAEMLDRSVVSVSQGRLVLAHCRIVTDRYNVCAGSKGREVLIRNCHLVAKEGSAVFWPNAAEGKLEIEGSVLESRGAISLLVDGLAMGSKPGSVRLSGCTIAGDRAMQVLIESMPRQPMPFTADHNVIDVGYLFVLGGQRLSRPKAAAKLEDAAPVLRAVARWSEEENVYRRGMQFVARPIPGRPGGVIPAGIVGVDKWLAIWQSPAAGSVEGKIVYEPRLAAGKPEPLVLSGLSESSGRQPDGIGPPPGSVGPGVAYHTWRKSPEYAVWPDGDGGQ
jgi:hypothetical protein